MVDDPGRRDSRNLIEALRLNKDALFAATALGSSWALGDGMNLRLLLVTLAAPACACAGEPDAAKRSATQESLGLLKQAFPYQPVTAQKTEEQKEPGGEIVKMERFVVVESLKLREFGAKMDTEAQRKKDEQFTPLKGGTIVEIGRLKVGTWPDPDGHPRGLKLLRIKF